MVTSRRTVDTCIAVCIPLAATVLFVISCGPVTLLPPTPTVAPLVLASSTPTQFPALPTATPTTAATASPTPLPTETPATGSDLQTVWLYNPSGVTASGIPVDRLLKQAMETEGITKPPLAGQASTPRVETILTQDPYKAANELFYSRGWTDGLPIVPPTDSELVRMLKGTDLPPDYLVATLAPIGGQATVEKIAVNAVMAGCRPEYMPVLIAAVEAVADPAFDLAGIGTTTSPDVAMLIVDGPIARQLDINSGSNALGRGWQANATIGRALHLILQNIGGSWPAVSDVSSLGYPGDFSMCLAENEESSPWTPLHVELGYTEGQNVVTVVGAEATQMIMDIGVTAEEFLRRVADEVAAKSVLHRELLFIVVPYTAQKLAAEGWTKDSIRQFIDKRATVPYSRYKEKFVETGQLDDVPSLDPNAPIQVPVVEHLTVIVSGGPGEKNVLVPLWFNGQPVSKEIRLPANWDELLQEAKQ
jgi:hypothetical protein